MKIITYSSLLIMGIIIAATCAARLPHVRYQRGLKDDNYHNLCAHFPTDTEGLLEVTYWPIVLQGGSVFHAEFRVEDPESVWQTHQEEFAYTAVGPIDGWIESGKDSNADKPLPKRYIDGQEAGFADNWRIGVLMAKPYKHTGSLMWNHGKMTGIAVNVTDERVVYFAETW